MAIGRDRLSYRVEFPGGSCYHVRTRDIVEFERLGLLPKFSRRSTADTGRAKVYMFAWLDARTIRQRWSVSVRGLSAKVGAYLAIAVHERRPWALAMLANIKGVREIPRDGGANV